MRNSLSPDHIDRIRNEVRNVRDRYVLLRDACPIRSPHECVYQKIVLREWEYAYPALFILLNEGDPNDGS